MQKQITDQIIKLSNLYAPILQANNQPNNNKIDNNTNGELFKIYLDECMNTYKKGNGELRAEATAKRLNLNVEAIAAKTREELKLNNNSLLKLIDSKFRINKETKLSGKTVLENTLTTDPESLIAYKIAEYGIIIADKDFKPHNEPIQPRPLQERIPTAILALASKSNDKNRVIIFQLKDIPIEEQRLLHFQNFHWKHEIEKTLGRLLVDMSNSDIEG